MSLNTSHLLALLFSFPSALSPFTPLSLSLSLVLTVVLFILSLSFHNQMKVLCCSNTISAMFNGAWIQLKVCYFLLPTFAAFSSLFRKEKLDERQEERMKEGKRKRGWKDASYRNQKGAETKWCFSSQAQFFPRSHFHTELELLRIRFSFFSFSSLSLFFLLSPLSVKSFHSRTLFLHTNFISLLPHLCGSFWCFLLHFLQVKQKRGESEVVEQ